MWAYSGLQVCGHRSMLATCLCGPYIHVDYMSRWITQLCGLQVYVGYKSMGSVVELMIKLII